MNLMNIRDYTKNIRLEDLAIRTGSQKDAINLFKEMQRWWSSGLEIKGGRVYSKLDNPLWFEVGEDRIETYYRTMQFLLEHNLAYDLSVRRSVELIRIYIWEGENITDSRIRQMAEIAANDKTKINYFSIRLKEDDGRDSGAKIEFAEFQNVIIGYEVCVPFRYRHLFDIRTKQEGYYWNNGLWMPDNYANLRSPFAGRLRRNKS